MGERIVFSIKSPEILYFKKFCLIGWIFIALYLKIICFLITCLSVKYHKKTFEFLFLNYSVHDKGAVFIEFTPLFTGQHEYSSSYREVPEPRTQGSCEKLAYYNYDLGLCNIESMHKETNISK